MLVSMISAKVRSRSYIDNIKSVYTKQLFCSKAEVRYKHQIDLEKRSLYVEIPFS